eukprot:CAMPEP_0170135842 /NCGR_PEP_ID=MMETSP0033_2-20121228/2738_1 /TAXON_ID=195969 /ORGANISM="Dolichomastix tenuilepis, Strain CCMP3274" /LENGTH=472 /DNA_ID=CAMNT_0010371461 /DNA_START=33 /DNA_END=1449 /DNA_ORIENTATION=-
MSSRADDDVAGTSEAAEPLDAGAGPEATPVNAGAAEVGGAVPAGAVVLSFATAPPREGPPAAAVIAPREEVGVGPAAAQVPVKAEPQRRRTKPKAVKTDFELFQEQVEKDLAKSGENLEYAGEEVAHWFANLGQTMTHSFALDAQSTEGGTAALQAIFVEDPAPLEPMLQLMLLVETGKRLPEALQYGMKALVTFSRNQRALGERLDQAAKEHSRIGDRETEAFLQNVARQHFAVANAADEFSVRAVREVRQGFSDKVQEAYMTRVRPLTEKYREYKRRYINLQSVVKAEREKERARLAKNLRKEGKSPGQIEAALPPLTETPIDERYEAELEMYRSLWKRNSPQITQAALAVAAEFRPEYLKTLRDFKLAHNEIMNDLVAVSTKQYSKSVQVSAPKVKVYKLSRYYGCLGLMAYWHTTGPCGPREGKGLNREFTVGAGTLKTLSAEELLVEYALPRDAVKEQGLAPPIAKG